MQPDFLLQVVRFVLKPFNFTTYFLSFGPIAFDGGLEEPSQLSCAAIRNIDVFFQWPYRRRAEDVSQHIGHPTFTSQGLEIGAMLP